MKNSPDERQSIKNKDYKYVAMNFTIQFEDKNKYINEIPEEHKKYIELHGDYLVAYIFYDEQKTIDAIELIDEYPTWDTVKKHAKGTNWTEQKHDEFFDALQYIHDNYDDVFIRVENEAI